jgi:putative tricarboxylic transport membrane protein
MKLGLSLATTATIAVFTIAAPSFAAEFPSRPIKIVHGSQAGAPQDIMLRELAQELEKAAGVAVVVESRPGGNGQVAMAYVKGQAADGHTVLNDGTGITTILQMPGAALEWTDFQPVYRIQLDPFALYVKQDGKYGSLADFADAMKKNPGQLRIGGYATGSPHQFTSLRLAEAAESSITWVPYNSGTDAIASVMGGDLDAAMSNISVYDRFKGKTNVLAVTSDDRLPNHPEVPTFKELGYDIVRYHWRGMLVREDTPDDVVQRLHDIIGQAVKTEKFQQHLAAAATLDGTIPVAEFETMLQEQAGEDRQRLVDLGIIEE